MIVQNLYLEKYDWHAKIFYAVSCYHLYKVMKALTDIGCADGELERAYRNIFACEYNTGLTYSNTKERESVIVIGIADSPEEYANSISHEVTHLAMHIAKEMDIDPYSEELCYLVGDIHENIIDAIHRLICHSCAHIE